MVASSGAGTRRAPLGAGAWLVVVLLAFTRCSEPTQVTLEITTDVPCDRWRGATITVGRPEEIESKPALATTTREQCTPSGNVGTLVLVPSARNEPFAVKVVGGDGRDPAECVPPLYGPGCIVARRTLGFVSDSALTLSVPLHASCASVRCGVQDTCVGDKCRSAKVADPAACVGSKGCSEGLLGAPVVDDCAALGQPADATCWDISAVFAVANYARDGADGVHVFGQRVDVGKTVYAFLDRSSDNTRTTSKLACNGASLDLSGGFDIERHYSEASGAYGVTVSGRSAADCGRGAGGSQCAGTVAVNPARGWRITGGKCNIISSGAPGKTDALGRPTECHVDAAGGTTTWQAGSYCKGTCCACPDATAYVDVQLTLARP